MTVIYAILLFMVLIFVHEFGHFIAAKACNVKVNEFAIGMGPAILKKQKGETLYAVRAIPIGGFCAMEGEDEESEDERAFNNKKSWQKIIILVAGAFMNLLLCIIIMSTISFASGVATTTISGLTPGGPAEQAGLMSGDVIIEIDGREVAEWQDVSKFIGEAEDEFVSFKVMRDGASVELIVGTTISEDGRKVVGILPKTAHKPLYSLVNGTKSTFSMAISMVDILKGLFTGGVSTDELTGPVGIVAVVNDSASLGFIYIAFLTAMISLNLAIVNMLPFPALDGGRVIFVIIRMITGKAITDEIEGKVHFIGIMLLFALMIYVTWNDIERFIFPLFN